MNDAAFGSDAERAPRLGLALAGLMIAWLRPWRLPTTSCRRPRPTSTGSTASTGSPARSPRASTACRRARSASPCASAPGEGAGSQTPGEYGLVASRHEREGGVFRVNYRTGEMSICYVFEEKVVCTPQASPAAAAAAAAAAQPPATAGARRTSTSASRHAAPLRRVDPFSRPASRVLEPGRSIDRAQEHPTMKLNDPTLLVERCLVGGAWIGEPVDPVENPATGEIIARVPRFGAAEATRRRRGGGARPSGPGRRRPPRSARRSCAAGST